MTPREESDTQSHSSAEHPRVPERRLTNSYKYTRPEEPILRPLIHAGLESINLHTGLTTLSARKEQRRQPSNPYTPTSIILLEIVLFQS